MTARMGAEVKYPGHQLLLLLLGNLLLFFKKNKMFSNSFFTQVKLAKMESLLLRLQAKW